MNLAIKILFLFFIANNTTYAKIVKYDLTIGQQTVNFTGVNREGMTVNDSIPAPTLTFDEGDTAQIMVTNNMDVATSVHWHGVLLPNHQDGVPFVNHPPIAPGDSHLFTFKLRQSGTYWYHSHTGLQEQLGVYGAIVILPKEKNLHVFDIESTVVLSDWIDEDPDEVLRTLKSGSDYYSIKKQSKQNLLSAIQQKGVLYSLKQSLQRMPAMDISDVAYDLFLANGKPETIIPAAAGDIVKLRLVNAGTASYFSLQYSGGDMQIIAADGIDVEPLAIKDFLMAIAETYTLLIKVPEQGLYELRASAQDGSGYSSIWIGNGKRVPAPTIEKPNPYQMNMAMDSPGMDNHHMGHQGKDHHSMHHDMHSMQDKQQSQTPYQKLTAVQDTTLPKHFKVREFELNLTGDMERYVWSINNEILSEDNQIKIKRGENIRFILKNKTMMHHPMHLHGHFFRVINGKGKYSPLKHTIDVPPMGQRIIEFEGNETQDWFFHCHILYHAKSGMARVISYHEDEMDSEIMSIRHKLYTDKGFFYASGSFLSQMTEGVAVISNSKNSLQTEWEVGWQDVPATEYEVNMTYQRYINPYLSGFAGISLENEFERGIFGVSYVLPLNFETEWRIDTSGEFRISIGNGFNLTNNINFFAEFEYDTESKEEWLVGLNYQVHKNIGLVSQYHSEFGAGAGLRLVY